jgi:glycosyltransferase involved in cell wall biosynthesis
VRLLFFNEGNLGSHIMGQGQVEASLRPGLERLPDVEARFVTLPPAGRWERAAIQWTKPPLARTGLDMRPLRFHAVQSLRSRRALDAVLRDWPADAVHVHSHSVSFALGGLARRIPLVLSVDVTVQDWWEMPAWRPERRFADAEIAPSRRLERRAFERSALVLGWTRWACERIARAAPRATVFEHHPGLDLNAYRPAPRRPRERPRILFVGGRFAEKGGEDLLATLGDQLGTTVDVDLVTPADVAERPGVRVHRLGPGDPALLDLQQQADLFCLPTHGDAAPWAVVEAMACGTPVLATAVGGIPDQLDGGRAGTLVPVGDRRALGEALRSLTADPQRRQQLAGAARARCEQRYDAVLQSERLVERLRALPGLRG